MLDVKLFVINKIPSSVYNHQFIYNEIIHFSLKEIICPLLNSKDLRKILWNSKITQQNSKEKEKNYDSRKAYEIET